MYRDSSVLHCSSAVGSLTGTTDVFINVHGTKATFSVEFSTFPEEEGSSLARGSGMEAKQRYRHVYCAC